MRTHRSFITESDHHHRSTFSHSSNELGELVAHECDGLEVMMEKKVVHFSRKLRGQDGAFFTRFSDNIQCSSRAMRVHSSSTFSDASRQLNAPSRDAEHHPSFAIKGELVAQYSSGSEWMSAAFTSGSRHAARTLGAHEEETK